MVAPIITAATAFIAMSAVPFFPNLKCLDIQFEPIISVILMLGFYL